MLGLTNCTHTLEDGTTVNGYLTDPLVGGMSWLLIDHPGALDEGGEAFDGKALLLGQQLTTTNTADPCSSPAPSSSAPAALAAG
jgi:hypothetical protein